MAGVDQNDRQVCGAATGGHVPSVLLVTWRVGDDEFSLGRAEITVGDVDRDALLSFGFQAVSQQRGVKASSGRADDFGIRFQFGHVVFVNHLAVVQQATNQSTLAIVDAAASNET